MTVCVFLTGVCDGARVAWAASFAALIAAPGAYAAGVMVVDDAGVVEAKTCQIETLMADRRDSRDYWVLPACNFTGNLELSLGGFYARDGAGAATHGVGLQAKTLFKPLESNGWGAGLAIGTLRDSAHAGDGDWYAYVPVSAFFQDDRYVLHANLGWLRSQDAGRDSLTWGLGTEIALASRTWLLAESFGENHGRPQYQFGVRRWLVADRVQFEASYGDRFGDTGGNRWFAIGLHLYSPRFLP